MKWVFILGLAIGNLLGFCGGVWTGASAGLKHGEQRAYKELARLTYSTGALANMPAGVKPCMTYLGTSYEDEGGHPAGEMLYPLVVHDKCSMETK